MKNEEFKIKNIIIKKKKKPQLQIALEFCSLDLTESNFKANYPFNATIFLGRC